MRFVAVVAAAVPTIIGAIALADIQWSPLGFDAPPVTVAGMVFRPWVAIATVVLGLLALAAAVSWDRESKVFMGALLVAAGIAIVVANPTVEGIVLVDRDGLDGGHRGWRAGRGRLVDRTDLGLAAGAPGRRRVRLSRGPEMEVEPCRT